MCSLGFFHRNRVAPILFLLGSLGIAAGCGDAPPAGPGGPTPASQAKEDSEREARQKAYGKTGIPPGTKKAADSVPKG